MQTLNANKFSHETHEMKSFLSTQKSLSINITIKATCSSLESSECVYVLVIEPRHKSIINVHVQSPGGIRLSIFKISTLTFVQLFKTPHLWSISAHRCLKVFTYDESSNEVYVPTKYYSPKERNGKGCHNSAQKETGIYDCVSIF